MGPSLPLRKKEFFEKGRSLSLIRVKFVHIQDQAAWADFDGLENRCNISESGHHPQHTFLFAAHRPSNQVESDQDNFQPIVERLSGNSGDRTITEIER